MDDELWTTIREFPDYSVSNFGRIYNDQLDQMMRTSKTNHGHIKVSLRRDGDRHTRSVAVLTAEAYCPPPNNHCTQVIFLDGDLENTFAGNLTWRPSWYAWKYVRQLKCDQPNHFHNLPVVDITTDHRYSSIISAGRIEGLLFSDIWKSTYTGDPIYPYGSIFEVNKGV